MIERDYVVPLRRGFVLTPRHKRAKKAISVLKSFLEKHCKAEVRIGQHLNETIWSRGIRNPPPRVKVHCVIEKTETGRIAKCELSGKEYKEAVKPEEKKEVESGLKGKLQQATSVFKKKDSDHKEEENKKSDNPESEENKKDQKDHN